MTPLIIILDILKVDERTLRPLIAIDILITYLRFFYFLRIFDNSSHLVRIIVEISSDIKYFLAVLWIGVVGFGVSFFVLSNNNDDDKQFIDGFLESILYSYRITIGDFALDDYPSSTNPAFLWIIFILATLFSMIILLNMLVAIMGDSFNRVTECQDSQKVREHL